MFYILTENGWSEQKDESIALDISPEDKLKKTFIAQNIIVRDIMSSKIISTSPITTLPQAKELMRQNEKKHICVIEDKNHFFMGVLSDRDIKLYENTPEFRTTLTRDVISPITLAVHATCSLGDATRKLLKEGINALPVLNDELNLCGILTTTDILNFCGEHLK